MIISHKHKFIFIRTNKTAGTSIEIVLSKLCGEKDIITKVSPPEDEEFRKQFCDRGPQNYFIPFSCYTLRDWSRYIRKGKRKTYSGHASAKDIKRVVDKKIWNEYFKFCFERNPWDRVISLYYFSLPRWQRNGKPELSISEFINSREIRSLKKWGFNNYTIRGNIVVDKVCLYEKLDEELKMVCERLGIQEKLELPRAKGNYRADRRHYREILSDEDREAVARMFVDEIALFNYKY